MRWLFMINLKNYQDDTSIIGLLSACMSPNVEKVKAALISYQTEPNRLLLGELRNSELAGLIGIIQCPVHVEIKHIAVKENYRGKGIGQLMIDTYLKENITDVLIAETDQDAVGFYRKTGFGIQSLGEKYPGRERFLCKLLTMPKFKNCL